MFTYSKKIISITICISILLLSFLTIGLLAIHEHHDCEAHGNEVQCEVCLLIKTFISLYKKLALFNLTQFFMLVIILVSSFCTPEQTWKIHKLSPIKLKVKMSN